MGAEGEAAITDAAVAKRAKHAALTGLAREPAAFATAPARPPAAKQAAAAATPCFAEVVSATALALSAAVGRRTEASRTAKTGRAAVAAPAEGGSGGVEIWFTAQSGETGTAGISAARNGLARACPSVNGFAVAARSLVGRLAENGRFTAIFSLRATGAAVRVCGGGGTDGARVSREMTGREACRASSTAVRPKPTAQHTAPCGATEASSCVGGCETAGEKREAPT